jgi:AAA domain-containing protein
VSASTAPGTVDDLIKAALKGGKQTKKRFTPMPWKNIEHDAKDEWLVKRIIPTRGVGILYGQSMTFKSFVALHIGFCIATGQS